MKLIRPQNLICNYEINYESVQDGNSQDERFTPVKIWVAHTGKNLNKSDFSKEVLTQMIDTLHYIPIVGFIQTSETNKDDFEGHEEKYIITENGLETEYLGRMYGFIPKEHNARFEKKTVNGVEREYLVADGILVNKFKKSKEIFDRDGEKGQSMELIPHDLEGYYDDKEDKYVITKATFDALCILGDSKMPAMVGGAVEKTQFTNIKFELQSLLKEVALEYAEKFTAQNQENEKGGSILDIKVLEGLLPKYEYVSAEFTEDLKGKLESFETEDALIEALEAENKAQYALTAKAQLELLYGTISNLGMYRDRWGDERKRYALVDVNFETMEVYVVDREENQDYGMSFEKNGEEFVVNVESKFKVAWQPVKLEGETMSTFSIGETINEVVEHEYTKFDESTEAIKESIKTEYDEELKSQKVEFEAKIEEKDSQLESLTEYKAKIETNEKTEFVNSIENLEDSEKELFVSEIDKYTIDSLKEEVAKVIGLKSIKFSVNKEKPVQDDFVVRTPDEGEKKSFDVLFEG